MNGYTWLWFAFGIWLGVVVIAILVLVVESRATARLCRQNLLRVKARRAAEAREERGEQWL